MSAGLSHCRSDVESGPDSLAKCDVVELDLTANGLRGALNASLLDALTRLRVLRLGENELSGPLPFDAILRHESLAVLEVAIVMRIEDSALHDADAVLSEQARISSMRKLMPTELASNCMSQAISLDTYQKLRSYIVLQSTLRQESIIESNLPKYPSNIKMDIKVLFLFYQMRRRRGA